MKKTMLVLLSVLMVVSCVFAFTACKKGCDELGHDWGEWSVKKAATCTEKGERARTCNRCSEEEKSTIAALGHDWNAWVLKDGTTAETCGKAGEYERTCKRTGCTGKDEKTVPATGAHEWVDDDSAERAEERVEATCGEAGVKTIKCSVCGATDTEEVPATGEHSFESWVAEDPATCEGEGTLGHKKCSVCELYFDEDGELIGEEEDLVIPALGHELITSGDGFESRWVWPATYAEFLADGVQIELKCRTCSEKVIVDAKAETTLSDEDKVEPTTDSFGSYKYTATIVVDGVTLTDDEGHTYNDVPKLPVDSRIYFFAGTGTGGIGNEHWNYSSATSPTFTRVTGESNTFILDNFVLMSGDTMQLRTNTTSWDSGSKKYQFGVYFFTKFAPTVFVNGSGWDDNAKVADGASGKYKITLVTSGYNTQDTDRAESQIVSWTFDLIESYELQTEDMGWYLSGSMNSWPSKTPPAEIYHFEETEEGSGIFTLTISLSANASFKAIHVTKQTLNGNTSYAIEWHLDGVGNDTKVTASGTYLLTLNTNVSPRTLTAALQS